MYPIITENEKMTVSEVYFTMNDGVRLYTRIAAPKGAEKCPIILQRTLYEDAHNGTPHSLDDPEMNKCVDNGFALVFQHCRGRGDSEGFCHPYIEREDGLRTLELIRQLPVYNGEIYLHGYSYLTSVHLTYLDTCPPDIKGASFQIQTDLQYYRNYRNGCCYNWTNADWWFDVADRAYPVINPEPIKKRPYINLSKRLTGKSIPEFDAQLMNITNTPYWDMDHRSSAWKHLNFPVMLTDGWYDYYIDGMFSMWDRIPEHLKDKSLFVVGPYGHATKISDKSEYDMPHGNIPEYAYVEWFRSIRENTKYPYAETGKVNFYSIGADKWRAEDFPVNAPAKRLYLNADGTLTSTPGKSGELPYEYDPSKRPNYFKHNGIFKAGKLKEGILSFESQTANEDTDFFGKVRLHVNVKSDCEDTAFAMRLYFVENGEAYNLTDNIIALSFVDDEYKPGEKILLDTLTPPIGFTLKKGCKLRIDIASDNDIYVPHANVKGHFAYVTEEKIANNTVICDNEAYIELIEG